MGAKARYAVRGLPKEWKLKGPRVSDKAKAVLCAGGPNDKVIVVAKALLKVSIQGKVRHAHGTVRGLVGGIVRTSLLGKDEPATLSNVQDRKHPRRALRPRGSVDVVKHKHKHSFQMTSSDNRAANNNPREGW